MYKIKTSLDINGGGWGLQFEHGVAFTDREDLARRLKSLGYEVEEVKEAVTPMIKEPEAPAAEPAVSAVPEAAAEETSSAKSEGDLLEIGPTIEPPAAPEAPVPEATGTDSGKLLCPICGKECGSQAVLTRHKNKEHSS